MTPTQTADQLLLVFFFLLCAAIAGFSLVDLWHQSRVRFRDVWATVYGDFRRVRAQRRAERQTRIHYDQHPQVVLRIRESWESKR